MKQRRSKAYLAACAIFWTVVVRAQVPEAKLPQVRLTPLPVDARMVRLEGTWQFHSSPPQNFGQQKQPDANWETIEVPCRYGSRLFWRLCDFPGFAVFIEEGNA